MLKRASQMASSQPIVRPLISIISISYQNMDGLRRSVTSVVDQVDLAWSDIELVIVDGGSLDWSEEFAANIGLNGFYVSEPDRGVYDAMNKGIRFATGRYLLFLNAGDTLFSSSVLSHVSSVLDESSPAWLVGGAKRPTATGRLAPISNRPHNWFRHAFGLQSHCHQATFFSRELVEVIGGYSECFSFAGDFDFFLRCGMVSAPEYVDLTVCLYEGGGVSERRWREIPLLQSKIRASRFGYPKAIGVLDRGYAYFRTGILALRNIRQFVLRMKASQSK